MENKDLNRNKYEIEPCPYCGGDPIRTVCLIPSASKPGHYYGYGVNPVYPNGLLIGVGCWACDSTGESMEGYVGLNDK